MNNILKKHNITKQQWLEASYCVDFNNKYYYQQILSKCLETRISFKDFNYLDEMDWVHGDDSDLTKYDLSSSFNLNKAVMVSDDFNNRKLYNLDNVFFLTDTDDSYIASVITKPSNIKGEIGLSITHGYSKNRGDYKVLMIYILSKTNAKHILSDTKLSTKAFRYYQKLFLDKQFQIKLYDVVNKEFENDISKAFNIGNEEPEFDKYAIYVVLSHLTESILDDDATKEYKNFLLDRHVRLEG